MRYNSKLIKDNLLYSIFTEIIPHLPGESEKTDKEPHLLKTLI